MTNPRNLADHTKVTVFFETNGYAEKFCTFETEDLYLACLPVLEKKAQEMGFSKVTESLDEDDKADSGTFQSRQ